MARRDSLLLIIAALVVAGCGGGGSDKMPATNPVRGKVVDRSGKALTAGRVEFQMEGKSDSHVSGEIDSTGAFSLQTIVGTTKVQGAPEGEYTVTVVVDPKGAVPPVTLSKKYKVTSGENSLAIKLE